MPGRTSSQFISAVLLAAPLACENVTVVLDGPCVSRPYLDITLDVMRRFGARPRVDERRADGRTAFVVPAGRGYRGRPYTIEGDASTASYFLAAAAIAGGRVRVEGVGRITAQGDARFAEILAAMGCHVVQEEDAIVATGDLLHGVTVDCGDMPDIVPTLAVVALFARGKTRIRNVAHLRFKESDRIAAVAMELRKAGARVVELGDGLEVEESAVHGASLETHGDHRLAMAFSLLGLRADGIEIRAPGVVEKSFPEYFDALREIGAEVTP
jgi:3-phosphoshikimate 1-carboxyvinyltransferase